MIDPNSPDPLDPAPSPRFHGLPAARPYMASKDEHVDNEDELDLWDYLFEEDARERMFAFPESENGPAAVCACCGSTMIAVLRDEVGLLPPDIRRRVNEAMAQHDVTCDNKDCWGMHDRTFPFGPVRVSILQIAIVLLVVALFVGYFWGRATTYVVLESRRHARMPKPQYSEPYTPLTTPIRPPTRRPVPAPPPAYTPRWNY